MVKKVLIAIVLFLIAVVTIIFIYRYQLFQFSAETIIRKALPEYIKIDRIYFDFKESKIVLGGFKITNPPNFSYKDLLEIEEVSCKYKMRGKTFMDGIEIYEGLFKKPVIVIERLRDARLNLVEMQHVMGKGPQAAAKTGQGRGDRPKSANMLGSKKLSDIVKLPNEFSLKEGKIMYVDRLGLAKPHMITIENIDAVLALKLNDSYSSVLEVGSSGQGDLNGDSNEIVRWFITYNPTTPKLTMSNRFEVSNLDIISFEPYYDRHSPLIFVKGKFSGSLIFDFDNGNIGSTNEIHLSDFRFYIKQGYETAQFWGTTVPDLVRYFSSPSGDIVFDFKIKGDMDNPKFYLGPISKQALTSMAIDKISSAIQKASSPEGGGPKSDIEKAKEYIDLFKGLINKK